MKKTKKALAYVVGATVIAGVGAYMAMPKETRENLKNMLGNLSKSKENSIDVKKTK